LTLFLFGLLRNITANGVRTGNMTRPLSKSTPVPAGALAFAAGMQARREGAVASFHKATVHGFLFSSQCCQVLLPLQVLGEGHQHGKFSSDKSKK